MKYTHKYTGRSRIAHRGKRCNIATEGPQMALVIFEGEEKPVMILKRELEEIKEGKP